MLIYLRWKALLKFRKVSNSMVENTEIQWQIVDSAADFMNKIEIVLGSRYVWF